MEEILEQINQLPSEGFEFIRATAAYSGAFELHFYNNALPSNASRVVRISNVEAEDIRIATE